VEGRAEEWGRLRAVEGSEQAKARRNADALERDDDRLQENECARTCHSLVVPSPPPPLLTGPIAIPWTDPVREVREGEGQGAVANSRRP